MATPSSMKPFDSNTPLSPPINDKTTTVSSESNTPRPSSLSDSPTSSSLKDHKITKMTSEKSPILSKYLESGKSHNQRIKDDIAQIKKEIDTFVLGITERQDATRENLKNLEIEFERLKKQDPNSHLESVEEDLNKLKKDFRKENSSLEAEKKMIYTKSFNIEKSEDKKELEEILSTYKEISSFMSNTMKGLSQLETSRRTMVKNFDSMNTKFQNFRHEELQKIKGRANSLNDRIENAKYEIKLATETLRLLEKTMPKEEFLMYQKAIEKSQKELSSYSMYGSSYESTLSRLSSIQSDKIEKSKTIPELQSNRDEFAKQWENDKQNLRNIVNDMQSIIILGKGSLKSIESFDEFSEKSIQDAFQKIDEKINYQNSALKIRNETLGKLRGKFPELKEIKPQAKLVEEIQAQLTITRDFTSQAKNAVKKDFPFLSSRINEIDRMLIPNPALEKVKLLEKQLDSAQQERENLEGSSKIIEGELSNLAHLRTLTSQNPTTLKKIFTPLENANSALKKIKTIQKKLIEEFINVKNSSDFPSIESSLKRVQEKLNEIKILIRELQQKTREVSTDLNAFIEREKKIEKDVKDILENGWSENWSEKFKTIGDLIANVSSPKEKILLQKELEDIQKNYENGMKLKAKFDPIFSERLPGKVPTLEILENARHLSDVGHHLRARLLILSLKLKKT